MQVICYRILLFNIVSHQKCFTYILFCSLSFTTRVITEKYVIIPVTVDSSCCFWYSVPIDSTSNPLIIHYIEIGWFLHISHWFFY